MARDPWGAWGRVLFGSMSLTRRGLFRGLGTAGVIVGCRPRDGGTDPSGSVAGEGEARAEPSPLRFVLNGDEVSVSVEPRLTLAALLRLDLDATGTKVGCDRGACGACTVLVDGLPRTSCMMLAHDAEGTRITTVEGLGAPDRLSALQLAFVQHDALQCGFCTSGMLMSCHALLERSRGRALQAADVERAIAGNLCRCGTYPHVVAAALSVAGREGGA
jgi:aerobic-type carbon monoxide dehydrogenase small subunit (CoxS/CutS family)